MTLRVTDKTPVLVDLNIGTQFYTEVGYPIVKLTKGGLNIYSPYGVDDKRATIISTSGIVQVLFVRSTACLNIRKYLYPPANPVTVIPEKVFFKSANQQYYGWQTENIQITPQLMGQLRWPVTLPGLESVEGKTFPVVVTLPGGPMAPPQWQNVEILGGWLVARGTIVLMADYRSLPLYGGGWPMSIQDVCAAVALARKLGPQYGGKARVILAAHSFGGLYGLIAATWPEIPDVGPEGRPDAFISIDAISDRSHVIPDTYASLGLPADPYDRLGGHKVPVVVVDAGIPTLSSWSLPEAMQQFANAVATAGHPTRYLIIEGADHTSVLSDETVLKEIMGA